MCHHVRSDAVESLTEAEREAILAAHDEAELEEELDAEEREALESAV
ncbi:MAG: hypothetical protein ACOC2A_03705 [Halanaeroarchaeum sp.]